MFLHNGGRKSKRSNLSLLMGRRKSVNKGRLHAALVLDPSRKQGEQAGRGQRLAGISRMKGEAGTRKPGRRKRGRGRQTLEEKEVVRDRIICNITWNRPIYHKRL